MARFLITYYGGGEMSSDPGARQQMVAAFAAWAAGTGDSMIDPGAPVGPATAVSGDGVRADDTGGPGGYTLLSADSLDDAVALVHSHPFLSRGGTLRISQAIEP